MADRTGNTLRVPTWAPAVGSVAAVVCLLAPWVRSGRVERSTIDLLSSASALDVWDGREEVLALGAWYLLPVLAAVSALAAGWRRIRFSAWAAVPIGPLMAVAWAAVQWSPFATVWGAWLGTVLGLTASGLAGLLLLQQRSTREKPAEGER